MSGRPTCGCCSGMFTANSMNCLCEALGMSLPGSGSMLAVAHAAQPSATSPPRRPGGAIALVRNGDRIRLDIPQRKLELPVSDAELDERRTKWQLPPKEKPAGCLGKYAAMATSASTGAILKW